MIVLADDQAVEQTLVEELQRGRQQRRKVARHQHARAGVGKLVRQRDLAVERRQMHDAGARLQCAEEIDGMIGRIAEEQRDRIVLAIAGAKEGAGRRLHQRFEFAVADRPVAEFERGARAELGRGRRQQIRQRAARDRIVPADALRIELLAGMGHARRLQTLEVVIPGWPEGPGPESIKPHPLQLNGFRVHRFAMPRNDGWLDIKPPSTSRPAMQTSCLPRRGA